MKILQINKYHYSKGGSETVYLNTCNLLTQHGHSIIHFSLQDDKNQDSPTRKYFPENFDFRKGKLSQRLRYLPRFFYNKQAKEQMDRLLVEERPDVAHVHLFYNSLSISVLKTLKEHGVPVVMTVHDFRLLCPSSDFLMKGKKCKYCRQSLYFNCFFYKCYHEDRLFSFMLTLELLEHRYLLKISKYVDQFIFVSDFQQKEHIKHDASFQRKGTQLYNFVSGLEQNRPSVVRGDYFFFYGTIIWEKGILTLINVAKELPDVQFKVAGTGALLQSLKEMNLPNVNFVGFQTGEALDNLIKNASYVIVPSEGIENNPMTITESYMFGKPVIASNIGGIPEIIVEGETGFLFKPASIEQLKEKIRHVQSLSDEEYARLSGNARKFAEENFDPENYYTRLMEIYNAVICH